MPQDVLRALLAGNDAHVRSLPADYFADVQDAQHPSVVSVCCSDSRVSQEGMFDVDEPGWLFTSSNIGNQAWDVHEGEQVVNGNLLYPVEHTGTRTIAVVGHTGCGAVTAAYRSVTGDLGAEPAGIEKWVRQLVPVIEAGLDRFDADGFDDAAVINRLVEHNVDRQVAFLTASEAVPEETDVFGFVYDFQGVYGDEHGRTYLTNYDGETDPAAIRERVGADHQHAVVRLLD